jgi:hypothetical protein
MTIVCVKCETEFKPHKNGAYLIEMFQSDRDIYKIWQCDIWKCPICGVEVVAGLGQEPIMEHFQGDCWKLLHELQLSEQTIVFNKELLTR